MTSSVSELRRQFGSIATLHPYTKGPLLTFTAFGSCLSDNVEVPCWTALGRVFEEGWKSLSEGRDEGMMDILRMTGWLGVLYRILQVSLLLVCCAIVLGRRESRGPIRLSGGYRPWGERYRNIAIAMMALSTVTLMITTLSMRLSETSLGSIEYPSLNTGVIGAIGLLCGTLWLGFSDGERVLVPSEDTTGMNKIG